MSRAHAPILTSSSFDGRWPRDIEYMHDAVCSSICARAQRRCDDRGGLGGALGRSHRDGIGLDQGLREEPQKTSSHQPVLVLVVSIERKELEGADRLLPHGGLRVLHVLRVSVRSSFERRFDSIEVS